MKILLLYLAILKVILLIYVLVLMFEKVSQIQHFKLLSLVEHIGEVMFIIKC